MVTTGDSVLNTVDMKVPTFFSTEKEGDEIAYVVCTPVVGVVFGGIHCVGWFFNFPSGDEALLWRVSSAVLTGLAFPLAENFKLQHWQRSAAIFHCCFFKHLTITSICSVSSSFISGGFYVP